MLEALIERASPPLQDAMRYWLRLKPSSSLLPARSSIDPTAIPHLLPRLLLMEVVAAPTPRLRVKIAGELILARAGKPLRGCWLDEAFPDRVEFADRIIDAVTQGNVIWRCGPTLLNSKKNHRHSESVALPFAEDGVKVDHVLAVADLREPCPEQCLLEPGFVNTTQRFFYHGERGNRPALKSQPR